MATCRQPRYDQYKLASPPEAPERCDWCREGWDECICPEGPRQYTREDYLADRADMAHSDGEMQ